jgi:hypothetical protein
VVLTIAKRVAIIYWQNEASEVYCPVSLRFLGICL